MLKAIEFQQKYNQIVGPKQIYTQENTRIIMTFLLLPNGAVIILIYLNSLILHAQQYYKCSSTVNLSAVESKQSKTWIMLHYINEVEYCTKHMTYR